MKKNKNSTQKNSRSERSSKNNLDSNTALILAILFFLLSLVVLAKANGFKLFDGMGRGGYSGSGTGSGAGQTQPGTGGTGAEVNLNEDKVIDTKSLFR